MPLQRPRAAAARRLRGKSRRQQNKTKCVRGGGEAATAAILKRRTVRKETRLPIPASPLNPLMIRFFPAICRRNGRSLLDRRGRDGGWRDDERRVKFLREELPGCEGGNSCPLVAPPSSHAVRKSCFSELGKSGGASLHLLIVCSCKYADACKDHLLSEAPRKKREIAVPHLVEKKQTNKKS